MSRAIRLFLCVLALLTAATHQARAQPKPDLTADIRDVFLDLATNVDPGDLTEGCATAPSGVDLLRFSVFTHNIGSADLFLGEPQCPDCATHPGEVCANPLFHCSPAGGHEHAHYSNYTRYELLDGTNQVVASSGKFGFCVEDAPCPPGIYPVYNCEYQGITAGCSDAYVYSLGCQYIDVTGLAAGAYTLRVTADPLGQIDESDETNNLASVPVTIFHPRLPDAEMTGRRVRLDAAPTYDPTPEPVKQFIFTARTLGPLDLPGAAHAPTTFGASLHVIDTAGGPADILFLLPSVGWQALGQPPGARGYRYRGSDAPDDCHSVLIGGSAIRARCQIVGAPFTPVVGDLAIELTTGDGGKRYCARFGGTDVQNDGERFKRKNAPASVCAP